MCNPRDVRGMVIVAVEQESTTGVSRSKIRLDTRWKKDKPTDLFEGALLHLDAIDPTLPSPLSGKSPCA